MAGISNILQRFTPVSSGDLLREVYPASWRMDVQDAIMALARGENIETGVGITKRSTPSSVVLRAASQETRLIAPILKLHPFQVYLDGYADDYETQAYAYVKRGWIYLSESDLTLTSDITDIHKKMTIEDGYRVWLEMTFNFAGTITTGPTLRWGPSGEMGDSLYSDVSPGNSNKWKHPLAVVRAYQTGKSPGNNRPGDTEVYPDPGEIVSIKPGYVVDQLVHTHLQKARKMDSSGNLIWGLVPNWAWTAGTGPTGPTGPTGATGPSF